MVIYIAGADPYYDDCLGRLRLTMQGLEKRDYFILQSCQSKNLPVTIVVGGGYAT